MPPNMRVRSAEINEASDHEKAAIKARQKRIEQDKKAETEAIEKRYANYIDRTFPVAVIFLVPEHLCEAD